VRDAGEPDVTGLLENEAEALIYLGRYEDALAVIEPSARLRNWKAAPNRYGLRAR
jgi:hypothetical protein